MAIFGWISRLRPLPRMWDLRQCGWDLCSRPVPAAAIQDLGPALKSQPECRHLVLVDAADLSQTERLRLTETDSPAWRLIMLGVKKPDRRAQLIAGGCAEALALGTSLRELDARARRVFEMFQRLPRWRATGPVMLDLFHRDGRLGPRWLGLHPREFNLLWRLAEQPGSVVRRAQLLHDVWRLDREPETNSLEVHISRLRGKLARLGCAALVVTEPTGGYRIDPDANLDMRRAGPLLDSAPSADQVEPDGPGVHPFPLLPTPE